MDRERAGREASPSGGIIDGQMVKAPAPGARSWATTPPRRRAGAKRHIVVDTDGRLLMLSLIPADLSDSAGAQLILDAIRKRSLLVQHLFADGAYDRA
jgi:hypothetical protein